MTRYVPLALLLALLAVNAKVISAQQEGPHMMQCAKTCDDCGRRFDACAAHCARLLADGKKQHLATLRTCEDCAAICKSASCVVARQGPFSHLVCESCAQACKLCGEECERHKDDAMMRECAEECRRCEKACRDMIQQLRPGK